MKKTLFLHIGLHKTGTSAIQWALHHNRHILEKHNLHYLWTGLMPDYSHNAYGLNILAATQEDNKHQWQLKELLDRTLRELASIPQENVILSAETLPDLTLMSSFKQFQDLIQTYFASIKIIIYLRRQDKHIQSIYQEWVKAGHITSSAEKFAESFNDSFIDTLDRWSQIFGENNISVGIYEDARRYNHHLIGDFLMRIGQKSLEFEHIPQRELNRRSPAVLIEFIRGLRNLNISDKDFSTVVNYLKIHGPIACANIGQLSQEFISPQQKNVLIEKYRESNSEIAKRFLKREDGVLFPTEKDDSNTLAQWIPPRLSIKIAEELLALVHQEVPALETINIDSLKSVIEIE